MDRTGFRQSAMCRYGQAGSGMRRRMTGSRRRFNVVRLREALPLGQRVGAVVVESWKDGAWQEFGRATSIGSCRLLRGAEVSSDRLRLRVTEASASPALSELGVFLDRGSR